MGFLLRAVDGDVNIARSFLEYHRSTIEEAASLSSEDGGNVVKTRVGDNPVDALAAVLMRMGPTTKIENITNTTVVKNSTSELNGHIESLSGKIAKLQKQLNNTVNHSSVGIQAAHGATVEDVIMLIEPKVIKTKLSVNYDYKLANTFVGQKFNVKSDLSIEQVRDNLSNTEVFKGLTDAFTTTSEQFQTKIAVPTKLYTTDLSLAQFNSLPTGCNVETLQSLFPGVVITSIGEGSDIIGEAELEDPPMAADVGSYLASAIVDYAPVAGSTLYNFVGGLAAVAGFLMPESAIFGVSLGTIGSTLSTSGKVVDKISEYAKEHSSKIGPLHGLIDYDHISRDDDTFVLTSLSSFHSIDGTEQIRYPSIVGSETIITNDSSATSYGPWLTGKIFNSGVFTVIAEAITDSALIAARSLQTSVVMEVPWTDSRLLNKFTIAAGLGSPGLYTNRVQYRAMIGWGPKVSGKYGSPITGHDLMTVNGIVYGFRNGSSYITKPENLQ